MCYNVLMEEYQPLHTDRHKSSFNLTLMLAMVVAVIGLFSGGQGMFLVVMGLAVAAWSWLTTPSQYFIYNDRLVIAYGRPRVRHVNFEQIDQVDLLALPIGNRLRVRLKTGRPMFIQPREAEEFQSKFQGALESHRRDHPESWQGQEG